MSVSQMQPTSQAAVNLTMPAWSRYAGQPIDATSRRSIRILSRADNGAPIGLHDDQVTIDFFYHHGRYWRAVVPLDATRVVYGQVFNFSKPRTRKGPSGPELVMDKYGKPKRKIPYLNHVQSRFVLAEDQPILLFDRDDDVDREQDPAHRIHDFVYSIEAVGPPGVSFNLRDALTGNLINAHRVFSTEEMVFERVVVEGQYVSESPPIELERNVRRELLIQSLRRSHQAAMHETYRLYSFRGTNNCTSTPLQILDRVVSYSWPQRLGSSLYRLPLSPRFYLWLRGLDSQPGYQSLMREQFADFISLPATQKRKREFVRQRIKELRKDRKRQA